MNIIKKKAKQPQTCEITHQEIVQIYEQSKTSTTIE